VPAYGSGAYGAGPYASAAVVGAWARWAQRATAGELRDSREGAVEYALPAGADGSSTGAPGIDLAGELVAGGGSIVTASARLQRWMDESDVAVRL
jgi:hypothetical protein